MFWFAMGLLVGVLMVGGLWYWLDTNGYARGYDAGEANQMGRNGDERAETFRRGFEAGKKQAQADEQARRSKAAKKAAETRKAAVADAT